MASRPRTRGTAVPGPWSGLGGRFAERRIALGLTQPQAADLAGISLGAVQGLERGRTAPRVDILAKLASALGLRLVVGTGPEVAPALEVGALRIQRESEPSS